MATLSERTAHRRSPAWQPQIRNARTPEEIIATLRLFDSEVVANRLTYLHSLADDDPDEPTIEIESLRVMALLLMGERHLPDPRIGVTPDGFIQIEWRISDNGMLAMVFLPSGMVQFAGVGAPTQRGADRWRVNGTLPMDETLVAVESFIQNIRLT